MCGMLGGGGIWISLSRLFMYLFLIFFLIFSVIVLIRVVFGFWLFFWIVFVLGFIFFVFSVVLFLRLFEFEILVMLFWLFGIVFWGLVCFLWWMFGGGGSVINLILSFIFLLLIIIGFDGILFFVVICDSWGFVKRLENFVLVCLMLFVFRVVSMLRIGLFGVGYIWFIIDIFFCCLFFCGIVLFLGMFILILLMLWGEVLIFEFIRVVYDLFVFVKFMDFLEGICKFEVELILIVGILDNDWIELLYIFVVWDWVGMFILELLLVFDVLCWWLVVLLMFDKLLIVCLYIVFIFVGFVICLWIDFRKFIFDFFWWRFSLLNCWYEFIFMGFKWEVDNFGFVINMLFNVFIIFVECMLGEGIRDELYIFCLVGFCLWIKFGWIFWIM